MTLSLLIIAIVLLVCAAAPDLARLRNFSWFEGWLVWLTAKLSPNGFWQSGFGVFIAVAPPVLILALLSNLLNHQFLGVLGFFLGCLVLYYGLGPRDLGEDLSELAHASQADRRFHAQQAFGIQESSALGTSALLEPILSAALKRQFAPIFWFATFGPAGVIAYRLTQLIADSQDLKAHLPSGLIASAKRWEAAMAWIPAQLMCLALALASDFDAVARAWHDHHDEHGRGVWDLDLGFLASTVKACIDIDDVDELSDLSLPLDNAPLQHTQSLLGRITLTWMVAMSVIVFAAYLT